MTHCNDLIVLDTGGTHICIGHICNGIPNTEIEVVKSQTLRVPDARDKLLAIIVNYAQSKDLKIKTVVLGIPGMLDRANDRIAHCNNIPQLEGQGLNQFLSQALRCTVIFEQDTMLQLLGEWRAGAAVNSPSVFGAYFGTGIGAAFLLNGNPNNPIGQDIQAGHIPIMTEGRLCKCGNTDCIEAYACGHVLLEIANRADCPVEQLFTYSKDAPGQTALATELDQFIRYQSYMLATIGTLFKPDIIVIGGGIPQMTDYPCERLVEYTVKQLQKPYPAESIQFNVAFLDRSAALHGALALLEINDIANL